MSKKSKLKLKNNSEIELDSLDVVYDADYALAWYYMEGKPRPCFTHEVLHNILAWYDQVKTSPALGDIKYIVAASKFDGSFNLGGDLGLLIQLIKTKNRQALLEYAIACIDVLYHTYTSLGDRVTTISLVQGDALGGGFEGALSSNVLIAEKSAKMGLPEVLFNLFPGMGGYSLLSRKLGQYEAEKMILSGKLYTAQELFDIGLVDVLVEDGAGKQAVYDYIKKENSARNAICSFRRARREYNPITYAELKNITTIWVDAALALEDKALRMMERLVKRQSAKA